jgi:hypothetical protein
MPVIATLKVPFRRGCSVILLLKNPKTTNARIATMHETRNPDLLLLRTM